MRVYDSGGPNPRAGYWGPFLPGQLLNLNICPFI